MSVASLTNRCKTVTITGPAGFAIVRGLRDRLEHLVTRRQAVANDPSAAGLELHAYFSDQIRAAHDALHAMESAEFTLPTSAPAAAPVEG
jgi:hypothetical protein